MQEVILHSLGKVRQKEVAVEGITVRFAGIPITGLRNPAAVSLAMNEALSVRTFDGTKRIVLLGAAFLAGRGRSALPR
jgi:hypothetical protein